MRILLMGATGMVGQGVMRECLAAPEITEIIAPVRQTTGLQSSKLREVYRGDFFDWADAGELLSGIDACFFCLGVSSVGNSEAEYRRLTYDLTLALAGTLLQASPPAVFIYVSGAGTNAQGRLMWARVKGETENALLDLPFSSVYCFRPGFIQPFHGVRSRLRWINLLYACLRPVYPLLQKLSLALATSTDAVGKAMLQVSTRGWDTHVLGNAEINRAAQLHAREGKQSA